MQDLPQELHSHFTMFYEELITLMEGASESRQLITKEKYTTILTAMIRLHNGVFDDTVDGLVVLVTNAMLNG